MPSDVLPVMAIGGQAVYLPYHLTWEHEVVDEAQLDQQQYIELSTIRELPELLNAYPA